MKKLALAVALLGATAWAAPAFAQPGFYAGAGYTRFDADSAELDGVTGRLGYQFNNYFALEGEGTFGVGDDNGVELDHAAGVYARGILPVGANVDLFGRVGYQKIEGDGVIDDDGVGAGVGVEWRPGGGRFGLRGEYTRLDTGDDVDTASVSGIVHF